MSVSDGAAVFPYWVKGLRVNVMGLTQSEFAHTLGVSRVTVTMWENGQSVPYEVTLRELDRLAIRHGYNQTPEIDRRRGPGEKDKDHGELPAAS